MLYSIQAARFLAAFMVLVVHCFSYLQPAMSAHAEEILYISALGNAGVHVFFVISGFVIVYAARNDFGSARSIGPFLLRRFLRIFPIYWILAVINIPVRAAIDLPLPDGAGDYALSLLLYPGHSSNLIFVGWSLSFEVLFYLVCGVMLIFTPGRAVLMMTGLFLVLVVLGLAGIGKQVDSGFWTNALFAEFVLGAWIAWLAIREVRIAPWLAGAAIVAGFLLFLAGYVVDYTRYPRVMLWAVPSALLVFGCVNLELAGALPAAARRFRTLGDASYSLYLVHAILIPPLLTLIVPAGQAALAVTLGIGVVLGLVSILAAVWVYSAVERPVLSWLRRRLMAPAGRRPVPGASERV